MLLLTLLVLIHINIRQDLKDKLLSVLELAQGVLVLVDVTLDRRDIRLDVLQLVFFLRLEFKLLLLFLFPLSLMLLVIVDELQQVLVVRLQLFCARLKCCTATLLFSFQSIDFHGHSVVC